MNATTQHSILWRRLDQPGHDFARFSQQDDGWEIAGSTLFSEEGKACRLDYVVVCDSNWRTRSGRVDGWLGTERVLLDISADASGVWRMNGVEHPDLAGCVDLDLSFTPATNVLPIRRLALPIGKDSTIRSAWLSFPELRLNRLDQVYKRIESDLYHYETPSLDFTAELRVNHVGMIIDYPGLWAAEAFA